MLKFIDAGSTIGCNDILDFKTSHVKVYLACSNPFLRAFPISKHPMLKFISSAFLSFCVCYCISKHPMLKFIKKKGKSTISQLDFKTSHVKVYRAKLIRINQKWFISKHPMLKFIGISWIIIHCRLHFKTSHVKVYLLQISLNSYQK